MDGLELKEKILSLKGKLDTLENDLKEKIEDLAVKEQKWKILDEKAEEISREEKKLVRFNICGKRFTTTIQTLLSVKDTFFYKMILSGKINFEEEVMFDIDPKMFGIILDFLRNKKFEPKRYNNHQLEEIRVEAKYFEISGILDLIGEKRVKVEFSGFEFNGPYMYSSFPVGTNRIEDISNEDVPSGIVANSPGYITIELTKEYEIKGLEIRGYNGNTNAFSSENGVGASIKLSLDKKEWKNVGNIPTGFGSAVKTIFFDKVRAKFIKFEHSSYIGIGYLGIFQVEDRVTINSSNIQHNLVDYENYCENLD